MSNPVLVEVTRGNLVESLHRGVVIAVDGDGRTVFSLGETDSAVFPRSACKAMQALPLMESGAADAYGFGNRELALACSSHSGEPEHVELAANMLAAAGRDVSALECGAHWSSDQKTLIGQARSLEAPTALHNNCSGKHSGFICACCHSGTEVKGYVGYDHPLQREIRGAMESLTGAILAKDNCGVDGCSIPTYAVPLKGLAHGFAKMATGVGLEAERARVSRRLIEACMAEPFSRCWHQARLHAADEDGARPHLCQDRGGRCVLRRHSGKRHRDRFEVRRWYDPGCRSHGRGNACPLLQGRARAARGADGAGQPFHAQLERHPCRRRQSDRRFRRLNCGGPSRPAHFPDVPLSAQCAIKRR